ncbi:MAG: DUF2281 domain-containing protein [Lewinellaceae bacterium]|jgi:hypothetical protein|nr:DUF2281 domain-containing protein [Lewinellaceae bacterium]
MSDLTLQAKIDALPAHLKKQVAEYIDFLLTKKKAEAKRNGAAKPFKPGFGGAKGLIVLSADWDAPLEDFKDYM